MIDADGREVRVSSPDRVIFEATERTGEVTKLQIAEYYVAVGDGMMLHCGDPIQYSNLNTSYWQSHFYAYGRPPYN